MVLYNASYYDNKYDQVASIVDGISGGHIFGNGNKRTAIDTLNMLIDDFGLNNILTENHKWKLISDIATGGISDVQEISKILQGR